MQFDEVRPEHFTTLSRNPFPHILIDRALQQIAGGSADGSQFRKDVLAAAGWGHGGLTRSASIRPMPAWRSTASARCWKSPRSRTRSWRSWKRTVPRVI